MNNRYVWAALILVLLALGVRCTVRRTNIMAGELREGQDLAGERQAFRTTLVRFVSAPQDQAAGEPPAGVEAVSYRSGDLRLSGWVTMDPEDGKRHPAVVYVHGGFALGSGDWEDAKAYAEAGYAVMLPMLRGENGNPGHFELFYGELDDVIAAGNWLSNLSYVDPSAVFVAGHSTGGTLAMLASLVPSPFHAAASFGGSPDQERFCADAGVTAPFDRGNADEVRLRSPGAFARSLRIPLAVYVGKNDAAYRSPGAGFVKKARRSAKPAELFVLPGDHYSSLRPAIAESIRWFARQAGHAGKRE